jgi:hypothetical protein
VLSRGGGSYLFDVLALILLLPPTLVLLRPLLFAFDEAIYGAINEARSVTIKLGAVGYYALLLPYEIAMQHCYHKTWCCTLLHSQH